MSNVQSEMNGLTVQAIVQRVVFEYHAPVVASRGLGQLAGALIRQPVEMSGGQEPSPTKSEFLVKIPYQKGSYAESDLAKISQDATRFATQWMAIDDTSILVDQWYSALSQLQHAALKGQKRAVIEPAVLSEIEHQMKEFNLGSVWRVKIQARWWYPEQQPGMHACKSGGFAKTVTIRTIYMKCYEGISTADAAMDLVRKYWGKDLNNMVAEASESKVIFDDRGTWVRTYVQSGGTIVSTKKEDGTSERKIISRDRQRMAVSQITAELRTLDLASIAKRRAAGNPNPEGKGS